MNSPETEEFSPEIEVDLKRWEDAVDREIRAFLAIRKDRPSEDEQLQQTPTVERRQV